MEFLDGETLMQRLGRGPLALGPAVQIAIQVAEALDRAHRAGIVHRDLKPSNVFLVPSAGASSPPLVKLLDFGLAKSTAPMTPGLPASPTVGVLTGEGTILGTLQYMAPEQLEGKETDHRVDVFAFGAVLHELLTGTPAFRGASQASLIASILTSQPSPVSTLQPVTPPVLDHLVTRALAKDPADRWSSMHDVLLQLQWVATHAGASSAAATAPAVAPPRRNWWKAATAVASLGLAAAVAALLLRDAPVPPASLHFEIAPPAGTTFRAVGLGISPMTPALSHDGTRIIIPSMGDDGVRRLWLRRLDQAMPQLLAGTENGILPFWSPDDRSIGFFADGRLMRLDLQGTVPRMLCEVPAGLGGTWNRDDVIVFSPAADMPLSRISASGGAPVAITTLDQAAQQVSHRFPRFLPDGRHFIYLAQSVKADASVVAIGSLDGGRPIAVMPSPQAATFVPPHWLVFLRGGMGAGATGGTMFAQRFDPDRLQLSGEPIALRENVVATEGGHGNYSFSNQGTLAYRTVGGNRQDTLVWFTRRGERQASVGEPADYIVPRLSPEERRVAVAISGRIWIRDLLRGTLARLTDGPADCCPVWSPDGSRIAYRRGPQDIAVKVASGISPETLLLANGAGNTPTQWMPDGSGILYQTTGQSRIDTMFLPLVGPPTPRSIVRSRFNDEQAQVSPDGRWIAYTSDESGRPQVYVQDFPALSEKWLISSGGGADPQWRSDGSELFFLSADFKLMAVPIKRDVKFEPGIPAPLFQTRVTGLTDVRAHYQPSADGQRFLVNSIGQADRGEPIQVVVNWPAELPK